MCMHMCGTSVFTNKVITKIDENQIDNEVYF